MEKQLTGKIESFENNNGFINADNGDYYDFESKKQFKKGDRVIFETLDSPVAFELACLGGPIPGIKVRLLKTP